MLEFIEGKICQKLPAQENFFREIGACCAKTHKLMQQRSADFPVLSSLRHEWTLESVVDKDWAKKLESIESEITKKNVKNTIEEFRQILEANLNLRIGVTHHDLNSLNIIGEEISGKGSFLFLQNSRTLCVFNARKIRNKI